MKKIILLLTLLTPMLLWAQDKAIESEILNHEAGKSTLISKGRHLLLDKFIEGDLEKVKEIDAYLVNIEDEDYFALYPAEHWLIQYWTQDYSLLKDDLRLFNKEEAKNYDGKILPNRDMLYAKLMEKSRASSSDIISQIDNSNLSAEDKAFLILSFRNLIADLDENPLIQDTLNTEADAFIEAHPESQYKEYTKQYVRLKYKPSTWGFAFEFFSGYGIFTDDLADDYNNPIPVGVAFDICYNKFELYLRDYIGLGTSAQNLSYSTGSYSEGSNLQTFIPEASLGFAAIDNNAFKISPFVGIGAMSITPPTNTMLEIPELEEIEREFTTTYMLGFSFDFKFGTKKSPRYMTNTNYGFMRLRYSYNLPQFDNKYQGLDGGFHSITIGFGGMARRLIRDL